ncbi:progranulin-like [Corythoichthys intestinalis]|uniref:progranulin-like n=1 Tax=Corythoichthys intestinalis TaxID=161448 RepID=UPI0025A58B98|nr:progranulin-like [Corythoichthys intestinalis]
MFRFGVLLFCWTFASCTITCPDKTTCSDHTTCCQTEHGYSCCGYPNAVCCPDLSHCCPRGFRCNLASQHCERDPNSWTDSPFLRKSAGEPLVIPFRTILHPENVEQPRGPAVVNGSNSEQELGVIRCSSKFFCPQGTSCCQGLSSESWNCCPYPLGECCADGQHCCEYGYACSINPLSCSRKTSPFKT